MNENSEYLSDREIDESNPLASAPSVVSADDARHERHEGVALAESIAIADAIGQAEEGLVNMPRGVVREIEMSGMPELTKVLMEGALAIGLITSPESALAQRERITIPATHVAQFEQETGFDLTSLSERFGLRVDHSIVTPGATSWIIHIGQKHGQIGADLPGLSGAQVVKSQRSVYGTLEAMRAHGIDTVFNEGHTDDPDDVRTAIQAACNGARNGEVPSSNEALFEYSEFFDKNIRTYVATPEHVTATSGDTEILRKIGATTMLGCEGKLKVLPAEDFKTNSAIESFDVFGDKEDVMGPYRKALAEAIEIGYTKTSILNFGDRSAIKAYGDAVMRFIGYDFNSANFDFDPMATLLSKLSDKEVRTVFEEFNQRYEMTKNKALKFDRENVALDRIGEFAVANPNTKAVPLVYGSIHNFVSSLPAYNMSHPVKFNYIRMNTSDIQGGVSEIIEKTDTTK